MAGKCDANTRADMPMRSLSGRKTVRLAILAVAVALLLWGLVIALGDGFIIHTRQYGMTGSLS